MKITHTPGPWHRNVSSISAKTPNKTTVIVCRCTPEPGLPERNANAKLIAAAPDLLAACKAFVNRTTLPAHEAMEMAKAAIAKAEDGANIQLE